MFLTAKISMNFYWGHHNGASNAGVGRQRLAILDQYLNVSRKQYKIVAQFLQKPNRSQM